MVWRDDLTPLGEHPTILAVGWLEAGHPYSKGAIDLAFVKALAALLVDPWQRDQVYCCGVHRCEFCRLSNQVGKGGVYVPASKVVYAAPSLIMHYLDSHEYAPPPAFVDAVLACPPMKSMAYLKAIKPFVPHLEPL